MASTEAQALYGSVGTKLSDTSTTACLTVPDTRGTSYEVTQVIVVDEDGTGGAVTVYWYDNSAATEFMLHRAAAVPATGALDLEFKPLHLEAGDEIRVAGAADQQVTVNFMVNDRMSVGLSGS